MNWFLLFSQALPTLINAVEGLFVGFPGQGKVKKNVVLNALDTILDVGTAVGVIHGDTTATRELFGYAIDDYVLIQNTAGSFTHGQAGDKQ